jgi:hypothetical protein
MSSRHQRADRRPFKETQVFGWDAEPHDERPSEFVPSTGYSSLSGYYSMPDTRGRPVRRSSGFKWILIVGAVFIALGTAALLGFLHLIRG